MSYETPRDSAGAKLCAWCGGAIRQSGVGRSRDYCQRLCRDRAYKKRRDQRLIDEALAAARPVSPSVETKALVSTDGETGSPQVAPRIPAPTGGDFLLAPPAAPDGVARPEVATGGVLPSAWRAASPVRRPLSRRRSDVQLRFEPEDQEDEPVELPPLPSREQIEGELARRVAWIEGLAAEEQ